MNVTDGAIASEKPLPLAHNSHSIINQLSLNKHISGSERINHMPSQRITAMILSFLILMALISEGAADETTHAASEEAIERRNVFTFFGGSTHDGAEQGVTIGVQYEYRFTKLFGFGGFGEYLGGDFDTWSIGTPVYFHPYAGWIIRGAPAVEFEDSDSKFAFQFGAGYEFLLSEKWGFAPEIKLIYSEGGTIKMFYGVSVNWGF
jgi:hypothetical protein